MLKEKDMKLSVIVPVYNVETYLNRCIDSIINQTYKNLEIILVDDGSTDKSGKICDKYAAIDSRIKVIHKKNGGLVSARKYGVMNATGDYITDVDSDDWIENQAFSYMIEKLSQYNPDMLVLGHKKEYINGTVGTYKQYLDDGMYQGKSFVDEFNRCVEKNIFLCAPINEVFWNKAIKADIRKQYQLCAPDVLQNCEDNAVIIPCIMNIDRIYVDSGSFYHYCVRGDSVVWKSQSENYENFLILSEYRIKLCSNSKNIGKIRKEYLMYQLFYLLLLYNPERLIGVNKCAVYPKVKPNSRIIVYGKGAFASRFIKRMDELQYCKVVGNIDISDINQIQQFSQASYDFIIIAIFSSEIVSSTVVLLTELGVSKDKILFIEKENLTVDVFPKDVGKIWNTYME